jgi:hypothetical protein
MIQKIEVRPKTEARRILFFRKADFTDKGQIRPVVPLFGANGSGKTTLLTAIGKSLTAAACARHGDAPEFLPESPLILTGERLPDLYLSYSNRRNNWKTWKADSYRTAFDPAYISRHMDARSLSEGQSIVYSAKDLIDGLIPDADGQAEYQFPDVDTIALIDELDSGLSLDNLDEMLSGLQKAAAERTDLQVFLSFNNPYVLRYFPRVFSMYDRRWYTLPDEDAMLDMIRANEEKLTRARKAADGSYRIF